MTIEFVPDMPTPTGVDAWWDLFLPATFGEVSTVLEAMERLPGDGDSLAVAARAMFALGQRREAERLAERAMIAGGEEADALATLLRPGGIERARLRMRRGRAGDRADAACDLALLHVQRGDADGAKAAIAEALALCPDHAEAARWARFLAEAGDPLGLVKSGLARRDREPETPVGRDAVDLVPTRASGWVSPERLRTRVLGSVGRAPRCGPGTSLGRLEDAGRNLFAFAVPAEHARLPADHPLARLEILADELLALVAEGRPAVDAARGLWEAALAVDETAADDAAHLLAGVGTVDLAVAPLAHAVSDRMLLRAGEARDRTFWRAYRAWHGCSAGRPDAVRDARLVLRERGLDTLTWALANATLRFSGFAGEAAAEARRVLGDPVLGDVAARALVEPDVPPRVGVSGRLAPRGDVLGN